MSRTVEDLREALFATIDSLRAGTMEVDRARAVSEVAQTIINSARVEVEAAKLAGVDETPAFLSGPSREEAMPPGIERITRHRLVG